MDANLISSEELYSSPAAGSGNSKSSSKTTKTVRSERAEKRRGGCRSIFLLLSLLLLCFICCGVVLGGSYATGYLQKGICQSTLENSPLSKTMNCASVRSDANTTVENPESEFPVKVAEPNSPVSTGNLDVAAIYEAANPSIVGVGIKGNANSTNQVIGSGFVVSENGLVATNQHVVSELTAEYYVKFEGSDDIIEVTEVYRDPVNDIAVLKINKTGIKALTLGDSAKLKPGQPVVAIGNPLGNLSSTVTSGIISGLHREVSVGQSFLRSSLNSFEDTIQTDAAINPGNSGGPLLDASGHVIGINFATAQGYENLSFAIPVSYLRTRIDELRQFNKFRIPYVGISYRSGLVTVGKEVLVGARIAAVDPKGSAVGKLKEGDTIVSFRGKNLEEDSLFNLIQSSKIGDKVEVVVIDAAGQRRTETIEIIETPATVQSTPR